MLPRVAGDVEVPAGALVAALDGLPLAWSHRNGHAIDRLRDRWTSGGRVLSVAPGTLT